MENNDNRSSDDTRLSPVAESRKSRRRFIRSAAVGSAVLLTLGNRAAWGSQSYGQNWGWKKSAKKRASTNCVCRQLSMSRGVMVIHHLLPTTRKRWTNLVNTGVQGNISSLLKDMVRISSIA